MLNKSIRALANRVGLDIVGHHPSEFDPRFPKDFDRNTIETILKVSSYTLTTKERLFALCEAVRYLHKNNILGDIVECGVWRGGSMMAVAHTLLSLEDTSRTLYLFDTFDGMSEPSEKDVSIDGVAASDLLRQNTKDEADQIWCYAPVEQVKQTIASTQYPLDRVEFVKGKVEDTIPSSAPTTISLLRLDTDWYESTKHELVHLFPRISSGGVIIIDDYGWWQGARQAVDEYIAENNIKILLNRIDVTGRIGIVA